SPRSSGRSVPAVTGAEELGRGGRLRGSAASELVAAAYAAESAHGPRLSRGLSLADLAHAVALVEGGDLAGEDATARRTGSRRLAERGPSPARGVSRRAPAHRQSGRARAPRCTRRAGLGARPA